MDHMKDTPQISVRASIEKLPTLSKYEGGSFSDLQGSRPDCPSPMVAGLWNADDYDGNESEFVAEWDEVKYIISGEAVFRDVSTGEEFAVSKGSIIWFPAGSHSVMVRSKDLKAFYVEQTYRPPTDLEDKTAFLVASLSQIRERVVQTFVEDNPKSRARFEAATELMPGGNTRSVLHYEPFPLALESGQGCKVTSLDGRVYLDCVSEFSAAMYGHSNPTILEAIRRKLDRGINLGGPGEDEVELARSIKARFPSIDMLRFCNSGTEANTMALALAKNATKRQKILAFENAYHGGTLTFAAHPIATTIPHRYVLGRFNDIEYTKSLLDNDIAAIIVEPMQGASVTVASLEFVRFLRSAATEIGAVLIFDEVVTSRLHINGLQGHFGVQPDMTTLGKYLGGGASFGAFGGQARLMELLDPRKNSALPHSGTYNNNVITMAAGVAAAKILTREMIDETNKLGDKLRDGINVLAKKHGTGFLRATGFGSMIGLSVSGPNQSLIRESLFFYLLAKGVYMGKRGFFALNIAHEEQHVDTVLQELDHYLTELVGSI